MSVEDDITLTVVGSKTFLGVDNYNLLKRAMAEVCREYNVTRYIGAGAVGADCMASTWAQENHLEVVTFHAIHNMNGKTARYILNERLIDESNVLMAFQIGESRGTGKFIEMAKSRIPVIVYKDGVM